MVTPGPASIVVVEFPFSERVEEGVVYPLVIPTSVTT
jgi:hypothetical protein